MLEAYDNALKSLGGWMGLASRAQTKPERLDRWFAGPDVLKAVTAQDIQAMAQRYLAPEDAVEFLVLPEEAEITRPQVLPETMREGPPAVVIERETDG
jgi:zinc protease